MKKVFLMAAVAAMTLASCAKTEGPANNDDKGGLVIKIETSNATRGLDNSAADEDNVDLENGWIFVFDNTGACVHNEMLKLTEAEGTGQLLADEDTDEPIIVSGSEKVYIIGNLPTDAADETGKPGSVEAGLLAAKTATTILTAASSYALVDLQAEDKFITIPVANANGLASISGTETDPANPDGNDETVDYLVNVDLVPLMSRVELVAVQAKDGTETGADADTKGVINAFTIGGVYVDSYYTTFNYGGDGTGNTYEQYQNTDFEPNEDNIGVGTGTWIAGGTPLKAQPADDQVWAYNVPSKGVARLIIYLPSVTYTPTDGTSPADDITVEDQYLTVLRYMDGTPAAPIANFERGSIYRIGVEDENELKFGPSDLDPLPNSGDGTLSIEVIVKDWVIKTPDAELM